MRPPCSILLMSLNLSSAIGCGMPQAGASDATVGAPPVAEKQPRVITVHGDSRIDNYFWLREKNNPKAMTYLHAENAYADAVMKPTAALQDVLFKEIANGNRIGAGVLTILRASVLTMFGANVLATWCGVRIPV